MRPALAIRGATFHTPRRGELESWDDALVEVDAAGTITAFGPADPARAAALEAAGVLTTLPAGHYLLPGLVDLHVHAPQWPQAGRALDVPLEDWLQRHTFPLEARYADTAFAREVYGDLVAALLAHGTTTAVYFATIHVEASVALAEICLAQGQRAWVGKVAMDAPGECPDYYRDAGVGAALTGTRAVIERIRALQPGAEEPLVRPVITPRFLPSCSEPLLAALGALAEETGAPVQTHCSESGWEVAHGARRFGQSDVAVLAQFGLLRAHTVLAHGNYVGPQDRRQIRKAGAAVAHCPLSNAYFAGRIFPLREALDEAVPTGLGSDLAGGHAPSILEAARMAVTTSRLREGEGVAIDAVEAFWLATAGGAQALGLPVGHFAPGREFDALVVDAAAPERLVWPGLDEAEAVFEKIVRRAGRSAIRDVWVRGRRVAGTAAP